MGLLQAISGLNAAHNTMNIIGNNIANADTIGFKSQNIVFTDLVDIQNYHNQTKGMGVGVLKIIQNLNPGEKIHTHSNMDLSINHNGFFRVSTDNGSILYTKNGHFKIDKDHNIINEDGMYLTGYPNLYPFFKNNDHQLPINLPTKIDIPINPTSLVQVSSVLNNKYDIKFNKNFNQNISNTYNHKLTIPIYDKVGKQHTIDLFFIKTADKTWEIHPINATTNTVIHPIQIEFDKSGNIISHNIKINIFYNKNNKTEKFLLNLSNLSEKEIINNTCVDKYSQNGYLSGKLENYEIDENGTVFGVYSNNIKMILSHIILTNFSNAENLHYEGKNIWSKTINSGIETTGRPGTNGFDKLTIGVLEKSNVDLNKEFINMIIAQRNYQSNSQMIKTEEKMFDALMNL
ncbi:MAG TPA: flagellar hook protein FlgE [Buchnera sp. (in: enterobacteria)]|nr:flagellar hook protein FlgE [Buchnera sp. (in: enterobacteria)]